MINCQKNVKQLVLPIWKALGQMTIKLTKTTTNALVKTQTLKINPLSNSLKNNNKVVLGIDMMDSYVR